MEIIEQLAEAALQRDSLRLRSLAQDFARANVNWSMIPRPTTNDTRLLACMCLAGGAFGVPPEPVTASVGK